MITASMPVTSRADATVVPQARPIANESHAAIVPMAQPNPSAQVDLTLGITVLTFHDAAGQVVATTPTQQQLNTYLMFGSSQHATGKPSGTGEGGPMVAMLA